MKFNILRFKLTPNIVHTLKFKHKSNSTRPNQQHQILVQRKKYRTVEKGKTLNLYNLMNKKTHVVKIESINNESIRVWKPRSQNVIVVVVHTLRMLPITPKLGSAKLISTSISSIPTTVVPTKEYTMTTKGANVVDGA